MYRFHFKKHTKNQKGFTLLETLVALGIIGIALVAATAALQNSLQTSNFTKDQITAYYLAQDAMEYVIALRDAGAGGVSLAGGNSAVPSWMSNLLPCVKTADDGDVFCTVDSVRQQLIGYTSSLSASNTSGILGVTTPPTFITNAGLNGHPATLLYYCQPVNQAGNFEHFSSADGSLPSTCAPTAFTRQVTITPIQDSTLAGGGDTNSYDEVVVTVTVQWGSGPFSNQKYSLSEDLYDWQLPS